jgi:hypothetical protein
VDRKLLARVLLAGGVALGAGCGPEQDCRDGIKQLQPRVDGAIGTGATPEANEQISQAYAGLNSAEELAKAGDFPACVERLEAVRVLLNKSQRGANQQ